ncbi:MAG TPA: ABC transporter permease [Solirubrobacterales bacterium]|jgi:ribose transport system permease protein
MSTSGTQVADRNVQLPDRERPPWHARRVGGKSPAEWLAAYGAVFVLIVMVIVFSILIPDTYPTWRNAKAILTSESTVLMVSLGLLVPAVVGEFDLSVGAMVAFSSIEMALLVASMAWPLALALTLASAVLIGFASGILVVKIGVNSFIATLGVSTLLGGGSLWISGGGAVTENIPEAVTSLGQNEILGIPLPIIYVAILAIVLWYGFNHMPIGRKLYATGGNRVAAELSGVRTKRLVVLAFMLSAGVAALAGVVTMMQAGSGSPSVGPELLLPAFAAVFLGSTTIIPGRFNVVGTVVGILLLAVGVSGLQQLGAEYYVVPLFNGGVLLVAVAVSRILAKERNA